MALVKAEIMVGDLGDEIISVMFNPTEYKISKQVNYGQIGVQSAESKLPTYQNGETKTLSLELFFDMDIGYESVMIFYDEGVRVYTDKIMNLTSCESDGKPPLCKFIWGNFIFSGYITSADVSFTRFNSQGIPIRAVINLSMIEDNSSSNVFKKNKLAKSNKSIINGIEDLCDLLLETPAGWKEIAKQLDILNPRKII